MPEESRDESRRSGPGRASVLVAAGILLSRIGGLIRSQLINYFIGQSSDVADAFAQAIKIPNFLQNLFGEGVISASFIPVYAGLIGAKNRDEADRVARTIFALLALAVSLMVLAGMAATPYLMPFISAGYSGEKLALTTRLVRILFPGVGVLVLSSWCLGVLNSHGKFFLSYVAPALWNLAMIVSLIVYGRRDETTVVVMMAWAAVAGSVLQVAVQFPTAWRFVSSKRESASAASAHVRTVLRNFFPVLVGRGVVQLSGYIDSYIVSWLGKGATMALSNSMQLYTLPVSLFGMSVSAAELPAMSSAVGAQQDVASALRTRIERGQRTMAAFTVPSAVAFIAIGDVIAGLLFQRGKFQHPDALFLWAILAGSAVGLLSTTLGRMYSAGFYAMGDTRTPLKFALVRVVLVAALGYVFALPLPKLLGIDIRWGTAGLTASAGLAGWVEFLLLRRSLSARIGKMALPAADLARIWLAAGAAAAFATGARWLSPSNHPLTEGVIVIGVYGIVYLGLAHAWGVLTLDQLTRKFRARRR